MTMTGESLEKYREMRDDVVREFDEQGEPFPILHMRLKAR